MGSERMQKRKKVYPALVLLLLTGIGAVLFFKAADVRAEKEHKQDMERFNQELKSGYQLLYGEWETTEFLGGGMPEYSLGNECVKLEPEDRERIAIYPDRITVDGKTEYGDICVLYRMIPEKWVYSFIHPWQFVGDAETELKSSSQDFYLLANVNFEGSHETGSLFLNERIFVKDSDTIIVATMFGFYKAERAGRLENGDMLEIWEKSLSRRYETMGDDYLDEKYRYQLRRYRLVYGEWRITDYITDGDMENKEKGMEQIGKTIEFGRDYLKVDGERAEGDVYILCNAVPGEAMAVYMKEQGRHVERENILKTEAADFYTVARVLTRPDNQGMQEIRKKIPGEGYQICVKDSDTLVIGTGNGCYVLCRTGYIDGVTEDELADYMGEV